MKLTRNPHAKRGVGVGFVFAQSDDEASIAADGHEVEGEIEPALVVVRPGGADLGPVGAFAFAPDVQHVVGWFAVGV